MLSKEEKKKLDKEIINENKDKKEKTSFLWEIIDFFKDLAIIIVIVLIIRTFFVIPFQINWHSMDKSYYDKEFIIIDRFSYLDLPFLWTIEQPKRWDVIVFEPHVSEDKKFFIKRIIWLPGETIKIEGWKVYLKNKEWEFLEIIEPYLSEINKDLTTIDGDTSKYEYKVPSGSYFVMWDNRNWSTDSRTCFSWCWGERNNYIVKKDIIWKLLLDLWYYDWIKSWMPFSFWTFSFTHPDSWIDTKPRLLNSPRKHKYDFVEVKEEIKEKSWTWTTKEENSSWALIQENSWSWTLTWIEEES